MKIQIWSDLHDDVVSGVNPPRVRPDVGCVVVAGDTCAGADRALATIRRFVPMHVPVVAVAGNHEFYGRCLPKELEEAKRRAPMFAVHFLENAAAVVAGVRFLGCTCWTDYSLYGEATRTGAMGSARHGMNDHRHITWRSRPWQRFRPEEAAVLHMQSRHFLAAALAEPFAGPTVVVTHHAPSPESLDPRFGRVLLNAAYASDLYGLIGNDGPVMWVHGHIHRSADYPIGRTRVLANPHGYGMENPHFDPELIVEIGAP